MDISAFTFKRFSIEHVPAFIPLFRTCFNKKITQEKVVQIFSNDPEWFGYLAFDGQVAIGFYGVVPFNVKIDGQLVKAAQSLFTMVHPNYRGGELVLGLSELTVQLAYSQGIKFFFGWPNSSKLFKGLLKWSELDNMQKYSFRAGTLPLGKIVWKLSFLKTPYDIYFKVILRLMGCKIRIDRDLEPPDENSAMIPRDLSYFNYKKALGSIVITIKDKIVWISKDYRLKIGDIEKCNINDFKKVLKKLKFIAFIAGLTEIDFIVNQQSEWNYLLKNEFESKPDLQLMYKPLSEGIILKSVHFTGGDFDTF